MCECVCEVCVCEVCVKCVVCVVCVWLCAVFNAVLSEVGAGQFSHTEREKARGRLVRPGRQGRSPASGRRARARALVKQKRPNSETPRRRGLSSVTWPLA